MDSDYTHLLANAAAHCREIPGVWKVCVLLGGNPVLIVDHDYPAPPPGLGIDALAERIGLAAGALGWLISTVPSRRSTHIVWATTCLSLAYLLAEQADDVRYPGRFLNTVTIVATEEQVALSARLLDTYGPQPPLLRPPVRLVAREAASSG